MEENNKSKDNKTKNRKIVVLTIIRILLIVVLLISIIFIISWCINSKQNEIIEEKISNVVIIENEDSLEEYKINFEKLKEVNNQIVCWIKVNGTNIEYPIVQAEDNSYYLKKNLEKKYNTGGWIFLDYKNKLDGTDKNIVIYGHNMTDDSMFGTLKNVLTEDWYNNE